MNEDLRKQAFTAWENLLLPQNAGQQALQSVLAAYSAPGRHYHTLEHLAEMTCLLSDYRTLLPGHENVLFACLWHDFVYDARRADNEEQSAQLWLAAAVSLQIEPKQTGRVAQLILATRKHQPSDDSIEMALFLDSDLAVLGAEPDRYEAYALGVRREYAHVAENEYRAGRSAVLKKFLDRQHLFFTEPMRNRFEAQARQNIDMEIRNLAQTL